MVKFKLLRRSTRINTLLLIGLLATLIVSLSVNVWLWREESKNQNLQATQQVQSNLRDLFKEHITLLTSAIKNSGLDQAEYDASTQSLELNASAIGQWVGNIYGQANQYSFQTLWREQTSAYLGYTSASKSGDHAATAKEITTMSAFPKKLTDLWLKLNPSDPQAKLIQPFLSAYVAEVKTLIDTALVHDPTSFYKQQHQSLTVMDNLANFMAQDVAKEHPLGKPK